MTDREKRGFDDRLAEVSDTELKVMLTEIERDVAQIRAELERRSAEQPGEQTRYFSEEGDFTWLKGGWKDLAKYMRDLVTSRPASDKRPDSG